MDLRNSFRDPQLAGRILDRLHHRMSGRVARPRILIMEVCGTHTVAVSRAGLRNLLPQGITLISGPGCPVCVTDEAEIDHMIALARIPGVILATYGDMMRVPGSTTNLLEEKAAGADVRLVYSALDAVELAARNPAREVVFLGVGFETTAPVAALAVREAARQGLANFSLFSAHKLTPPAMRALMADPTVRIDAFLCPGHVSTILGEDGFAFLARERGMPAAIAGFEPLDILRAVEVLVEQVLEGQASLFNGYRRAVRAEGNPLAREVMSRCFEATPARWRGLGEIPASGLKLRPEYEPFDAEKRFSLPQSPARVKAGCRCGEVLKGKLDPRECPLFARGCDPTRPVGPCMVSTEGACAAYYQYER